MTDAQRVSGGAAGAEEDGAAHLPRTARRGAPPGEPGTGPNGDPAEGGERSAGSRPAAPDDGLATGDDVLPTGTAQAPARTAVAVAEAPPSAGTAPAPEEQPA